MSDPQHILLATTRSPGPLSEALGPSIQLHHAAQADECIALAASLHPEAALIDLCHDDMGEIEFLRTVLRSLGDGVPVIGIGDETRTAPGAEYVRAGLWDVWYWRDEGPLFRKRLEAVLGSRADRRRIRRARRKRRDSQKALIAFLRRLDETLGFPLDGLDAFLSVLYAEAGRGVAPSRSILDEMACHHQEVRRVLARMRQLSRNLAESRDREPGLARLETEAGVPRDEHREAGRDTQR
jgi:hypothetical protein